MTLVHLFPAEATGLVNRLGFDVLEDVGVDGVPDFFDFGVLALT